MKVFIVLCVAVASTCAFDLRGSKNVDISPVVPFFEPESRITNGELAEANQFPYQVGLKLMKNELQYAWCGGSLIHQNWVLTAAHCTDGIQSITAYFGSTTREGGKFAPVTRIIIHSGWERKTLANDISLLRIAALPLSSSINIIALPAESGSYSTYVNEVAVASGWGRTKDSGSVVDDLQFAYLTIVENSVCTGVFGTSVVRPSNICVATPGGTSTCNGDSGGPLVTQNTLVGITSYGSASGCTKGYPAVFTRVSSYRSWIKEMAGF